MNKKICFVLDSYPTNKTNGCVFAKHLICAIADRGYDCTVIAPRILSKTGIMTVKQSAYYTEEFTLKGRKIKIFRPFYLHLSSHKRMMGLSMNNHFRSVMRVIKHEKLEPDVIYGHFIYQCGLTAARVGEKLGIPSYCACGENSLRLQEDSMPYCTGLKYHNWASILKKLSGIVCVSGNNKELLLKSGFVDMSMKMGVFPNGIDKNKFCILDKETCRRELGFPHDAFIVAFTGTFSSNKGMDRLNDALNLCDNTNSIFMGQGALKPNCRGVLYSGRVPNDQVSKYLNAADVFVLPTRGEGCCNAIVEALACGLPVISSDLPFNDDILSTENSIRIDVESVEQIREAIERLKDDNSLRETLASGAQKTAEGLSIEARAEKILEFMNL